MIWLLVSVAGAQDLPDRLALTLEEGTSIGGIAAHEGEEWLAWLEEGSQQVRVLDGQTWEVTAVSVCTDHGGEAAGLATWEDASTGEVVFYVGCGEGVVERVSLTDRSPALDDDGEVEVSEQAVLGVVADDEVVVVVEAEDGSGAELHAFDPSATSEVTDPFATPTRSGYADVGLTSSAVFLVHGDRYVTEVLRSSGAAATSDSTGSNRTYVDITTDGSSVIFLADSGGTVGKYTVGSNEIGASLGAAENGLDEPHAVWLQPEGDDPYLAVGDDGLEEILLFSYSSTSSLVTDEVVSTLDAPGGVRHLASIDDVLAGGTADGRVHLFTDDPWVEISDSTVDVLASGDTGTVTFSADVAGSWTLRLGSRSGDTLDSGSASADETVTATYTVDETFAEGDNRLWVLVDDGHDAVDVSVDDPPGQVDLTSSDLAFGDQSITLDFEALGDTDLARYEVWFSTTSFDGEDYPTGGPAFSEGELTSPVEASEGDDGRVTVELTPLTNHTLYYVAVRAVDDSGQEGPMSTVFEVIPEPVAGAAGLAGESGGFTACASSSGPAAAALAFMALLGLGRRRPWAGLVLLGLAASASPSALALPPLLDLGVDSEDKKSTNVELRLAGAWFTDDDLTDVYGVEGTRALHLERGWQFYRILEVDLLLDVRSDRGELVGETSRASSGEDARMRMLPVGVAATLRLDLFDGQPVVPYASVGFDYLLWWETTSFSTTDPFASERIGGGKPGWHWNIGLDFLLDPLEPDRADGALARWGVRDTYLTVSYQQFRLLPGPAINDQGIDFDHSQVSVGLKLDR